MKRLFPSLLMLGLTLSLAVAQTTSGLASKMTPQQLGRLRTTKRHFLVPTYVPVGFEVQGFRLQYPKDPLMLSWILTYKNPKTKASFILQMCSEGIGDVFFVIGQGDTVEATGRKTVSTRPLGKVEVEEYIKGKHQLWHVNWVDIGPKAVPKFISLIGERMSPSVGHKIVQGLRWLK